MKYTKKTVIETTAIEELIIDKGDLLELIQSRMAGFARQEEGVLSETVDFAQATFSITGPSSFDCNGDAVELGDDDTINVVWSTAVTRTASPISGIISATATASDLEEPINATEHVEPSDVTIHTDEIQILPTASVRWHR